MKEWEYDHDTRLANDPQSYHDMIRYRCRLGWEPWHMERAESGARTVYFKRLKRE